MMAKRKQVGEDTSVGELSTFLSDRQLLSSIPTAIAWVDCEMQILAVTQRWLRDYHLEDRQIVGQFYDRLPILRPPNWKQIQQQCLTGETWSSEAQKWVQADGTIDWLIWEICPWYNCADRIGGLTIQTTFIPSPKLTAIPQTGQETRQEIPTPEPETLLAKERSLLEAVLRYMPVGAIVAAAPSGRLIWRNQQAEQLSGGLFIETKNLQDYEQWRGFHPDGQPYELDQWPIIRSITTGETIKAEEITIEYDDRTRGVLLISSAPIRNLDGTIVGGVTMFWDITDRKQIEQQILHINQDLEQRVQERTAQLEATNRELEAFSYSVSHDLRAPLRGIDGFSQALLMFYEQQLDEQAKHYLDRIRANSLRMGELIDDLLGLSRVTRTQMQRTQVDLSAIAAEIMADFCQTAPQREVEFINTPVPTIANGDPRLLRIVLENLLNNAWKYTCRQPKAQICFGAIENHGKLAFFVRDNGAGFDMDYADKLFGAFQRLHSESEFPGTGIGLATVKRIIHKHCGQVWAESAVDRGATFYFTLY